MKLASKYTSALQSQQFDAIIIGSGISGLAAAVLLSRAGRRVLVLEQHFKVGGYTHAFQRKGYEWDVGLHYVGDLHRPHSISKVIFDEISGGNLKWAPMGEVYDRIIFPDQSYDFVAGHENFRNKMISYFPREERAISRYLDLVREVSKSMKKYAMNKALPSAAAKLAYQMMSAGFLKYASQTTLEVLSSLTSDKKLIGVLTGQWGDYGLPPARSSFAMHAILANHYLDGANYPVGGSGRIAETIVPELEKLGGVVAVHAPVDEILLHKNRVVGVRLQNGDELNAPVVISSAGVFNTFGKLLKSATGSDTSKNLERVQRSTSYVCLYLGFKHSARELGLEKTNLWVYSGYDHDRTLADYLDNPGTAQVPLTYLSFASAKDPSWEERHPDTATMEAISVAPFEWFTKWQDTGWQKRGSEYEAFKKELTDRLLEKIYETLPQIRGKIDHVETSTPLSNRHFSGYEFGELYGLDHSPERFQQRWLRPQTRIKNLFLTGQDVVSCGITGALLSGALTVSAILRKNVIGEVLQRAGKKI